MAIYSGNYQIVGPYVSYVYAATIPQAFADVITKSTTGRTCVLEACLQSTTAAPTFSSASISISRSTNTPVQSGQTYLLPENPSDSPSLTSVATAWSVAPTLTAASSIRRYAWTSNTAGNGVIFSFLRGLSVSPTNSICISAYGTAGSANSWNSSVNAVNGYFVVNE